MQLQLTAILFTCAVGASAFTPQQTQSLSTTSLSAVPRDRKTFLTSTIATTTACLTFTPTSIAEDDSTESVPSTPTTPARTITGCPKNTSGKSNNCVSTSNAKQLDLYSSPWTFESSAEEAFARLKGLVKSDPLLEIVEVDEEGKYLRAEAKRLNTVDSIEFLVRADDNVVVFKSEEKGSSGISDFGANRKRLDDLRLKSGGYFNVIGGYDLGMQGKKTEGAFGQLKAFYGLQSGQGFESVFD